MSEELIKADYGPSPLKPIALPLFVLMFLIGGGFLYTVVLTALGAICVLMAFAIAYLFVQMKAAGLGHFTMILVVLTAAIWIPLNFKVQSMFIKKFSELGGERRFLAAVLLLVSTLPLFLLCTIVQLQGSLMSAGVVMPLGLICGLIAQIIACVRIYKSRFAPLSSFACLPPARVRAQTEQLLLDMQIAKTKQQLDELTIKVLPNFGINKIKLRGSDTAPVEVLIEILVKQHKAEVANAISRNYLHVVENDQQV